VSEQSPAGEADDEEGIDREVAQLEVAREDLREDERDC